jgi:hypothetical protein
MAVGPEKEENQKSRASKTFGFTFPNHLMLITLPATAGFSMKTTKLLMAALYETGSNCANIEALVKFAGRYLSAEYKGSTQLAKDLGALLRKWSSDEPRQLTKAAIVRRLVASDLAAASKYLFAHKVPDAQQQLHECLPRYMEVLGSLGLDVPEPSIFVVRSMPAPFDSMDFEALCIDSEDERRYRISAGIYFDEKHLCPTLSASILAHELVHFVVSQRESRLLGRGLEEGLSELVGSLYLGARILGAAAAKNIFIFNQLGAQPDRFWDLYLEYTRQAAYIYRRFGLRGLAHLLRTGRPAIKIAERQCLNSQYAELRLPEGQWDDDLSTLVETVTSTYIRNLFVSPVARYIAGYVKDGASISQISDEACVTKSIARQAIKEIQQHTFTLVESHGHLEFSDVGMLISSNSLRYSLGATSTK